MRAVRAEAARALARGHGAERILILVADAEGRFTATAWGATDVAREDMAAWFAGGWDAVLAGEIGAPAPQRVDVALAGPELPEPPGD